VEPGPVTDKDYSDTSFPMHEIPPMLVKPSFINMKSIQNLDLDVNSTKYHIRQQSFQLHRDLSLNAFINVERNELNNVLSGENWLAVLLAAAEGLPIGFALLSIQYNHSHESRDSVMFVNHHFQLMTGCTRHSVLGKSLADIIVSKATTSAEATLLMVSLFFPFRTTTVGPYNESTCQSKSLQEFSVNKTYFQLVKGIEI
jgi:hypothetical protein